MTTTVVLYGRPDCHLCDEARDAIRSLQEEMPGLTLREVDIDEDEELLRRYLERIPVVEIGGSVVAELVVDVDTLRASVDTLSR